LLAPGGHGRIISLAQHGLGLLIPFRHAGLHGCAHLVPLFLGQDAFGGLTHAPPITGLPGLFQFGLLLGSNADFLGHLLTVRAPELLPGIAIIDGCRRLDFLIAAEGKIASTYNQT
jgi:hypothetical protein